MSAIRYIADAVAKITKNQKNILSVFLSTLKNCFNWEKLGNFIYRMSKFNTPRAIKMAATAIVA